MVIQSNIYLPELKICVLIVLYTTSNNLDIEFLSKFIEYSELFLYICVLDYLTMY